MEPPFLARASGDIPEHSLRQALRMSPAPPILRAIALPPQSPYREQLLPTYAESVDAAAAEATQAFCQASPEIEAAYVCLTERTRAGAEPERAFRLSVKLVSPVSASEDTRAASVQLVQRLSQTYPELMRRFGYGVLADRAVPAWERYGVKVFSRLSGDIP